MLELAIHVWDAFQSSRFESFSFTCEPEITVTSPQGVFSVTPFLLLVLYPRVPTTNVLVMAINLDTVLAKRLSSPVQINFQN